MHLLIGTKTTIMRHALSPTPADETGIALAKIQFEQQSPAGLIAWYNKQQKPGMVGVHRQVLRCLALHEVFQERFGYSPFVVEGQLVVGFGPPLALTPGGIEAVV
ncbi:MAG: hypothetical protein JNK44_09160 [Cyclobacteriaceae bacterium]|nr:hypothetical protein [Cyclobacteriaceae bacterium]